jgi:CBS domain-containing protein
MSPLSVRTWMSTPPLTITPKESLQRARALLRTAQTAELLVVDEGKLVGMVSEGDIWKHCPTGTLLLDDRHAGDLLARIRVGGIMALHPPTLTPDTPLREAAQLFAASGRQALPVVEDGIPIGLLTGESVMRAMAALLREVEQGQASKGEG